MVLIKRNSVWWYDFSFGNLRIREPTKSKSKTVAREAELQRRRDLERGIHNITEVRQNRIRPIAEIAKEYLADYRLRNRSGRFAEYAIGHVTRLLGDRLVVDIDDRAVLQYQSDRLRESAAPKSINEEVRFLLTMIGDAGELIRTRLRKKMKLKLRGRKKLGKAYEPEETKRLRGNTRKSRSHNIRLALALAINAGMRDSEIKALKWGRIHLDKWFLQVGESKTPAGEGRTIPINDPLNEAFLEHRAWYLKKFKETRLEWYVFPFGRGKKLDPSRHVTTLKTAWGNLRKWANVSGRWHDHRHTLITQLAENGHGEETIRQIVGHVSPEVLRDYLHVRMKAKRAAVESIAVSSTESKSDEDEAEGESPEYS